VPTQSPEQTDAKTHQTKTRFLVVAIAVLVAIIGWLLVKPPEKVVEGESFIRGLETYVYGFPLVMMDVTRQVMTAAPTAGEFSAPINQFQKLRGAVPWNFNNVVRISTNSLWMTAFLDLDQEPLIVTIPDSGTIPVAARWLNMWTDAIGTAGSRTPEVNGGNYLIAGPGWKGAVPADVKKVYNCQTRYSWMLVELSAASAADYPAIHVIQDKFKVTPLSAWGKPYEPPTTVPVDPNVDLTATPYDQVRLMTGEMFFKKLAQLMKENPPYPADKEMLERLKKIGVEPGKDFDAGKLDPAIRKGIDEAPALVWMKFFVGPYGMKPPNGWVNMVDIARFGTDYQTRAYVAYMGLGAGIADDIVYPSAFVDAKGEALDGAFNYTMHFDKAALPASKNGVWSISAYRENFYETQPDQPLRTASGHGEVQPGRFVGRASPSQVSRPRQGVELVANSTERVGERDPPGLRPERRGEECPVQSSSDKESQLNRKAAPQVVKKLARFANAKGVCRDELVRCRRPVRPRATVVLPSA
jgi:hypothetical protein